MAEQRIQNQKTLPLENTNFESSPSAQSEKDLHSTTLESGTQTKKKLSYEEYRQRLKEMFCELKSNLEPLTEKHSSEANST